MPRSIIRGAVLAAFAALVVAHPAHAATVSGLDKQYLSTAIEGDRFEIAGGNAALAKSQNPAIKVLAARLVKDHTKSLKEAVALAHRYGVDVPDTPSPSEEWELSVLAAMTGPAYDHWYAALEVKDHVQDISEAHAETADGTNTKVRRAAHAEVSVLKRHLKLSRTALAAAPLG